MAKNFQEFDELDDFEAKALYAEEQPGEAWGEDVFTFAEMDELLVEVSKAEKGATEMELDAITCGKAVYPLKSTLRGRFVTTTNEIRFVVDAFLPTFVGEGTQLEQAFERWCEAVHVMFQRLRATPHHMQTKEQSNVWDSLSRHLDVAAYESSRRHQVRQQGRVISAWPKPWKVVWDDGREEHIELSSTPDDFAALEEGDAFEAFAERDAASGRLAVMLSVKPKVEGRPTGLPKKDKVGTESYKKRDLPLADWSWMKQ